MNNRRLFIKNAVMAMGGVTLADTLQGATMPNRKIRVLVWDERQAAGKQAYGDFLGNSLAAGLQSDARFEVKSAGLDDPAQGLDPAVLDKTDVLIWWGHIRHNEISVEQGEAIVQRILSGKLHFIGLHSAHWSTPFVEAMNEVTRQRIRAQFKLPKEAIQFVKPAIRTRLPDPGDRIGPYTEFAKFPDGRQTLTVHLPNCCFPHVADEGKQSVLKVKNSTHPIVKGLPAQLTLSRTEMYGEPFHVPEPDELLLEEYWPDGKWFRSGLFWKLGMGKVFYFRPGHENYPIFKEQWVLKILANCIQWMGSPH